MGWEGLFALFYSIVGDGDDEIDEDGGGRGGGGGGGKWHFGTDQCTTYRSPSGVCDSGIRRLPCMM